MILSEILTTVLWVAGMCFLAPAVIWCLCGVLRLPREAEDFRRREKETGTDFSARFVRSK